jgi:ABC-type antimicrobial peptide transport system permease subunit
VSHPPLYGWNWNFAIDPEGGDNVPPFVGNLLDHDRDVAAWTGFGYADVLIDDQTVPTLLATSTHAAFSPPILSGHAIQAKNQIVLGAATLASLHRKIGQSVTVSYGSPKDAPIYQPPTDLVIVGTATMPAIGTSGTLHPSMGTGALLSSAELVPVFARALINADPNLNGPAIDVVRIRGGVTQAAALSSLNRIADAADKALANDAQTYGDSFVVLGLQRPAEIVNYQSTGASPGILAASLAVGAIAALGLTLGASVRRRRRDLALLKTLGFTRRQLALTVAWQASVAAIIGIIVGVPAGIALGRWLWDLFARDIYAVPLATVPALEIFLVAIGALVLANLVAAVPGQMAARTSTGVVLRAE